MHDALLPSYCGPGVASYIVVVRQRWVSYKVSHPVRLNHIFLPLRYTSLLSYIKLKRSFPRIIKKQKEMVTKEDYDDIQGDIWSVFGPGNT
jgi:hypothetical protein